MVRIEAQRAKIDTRDAGVAQGEGTTGVMSNVYITRPS